MRNEPLCYPHTVLVPRDMNQMIATQDRVSPSKMLRPSEITTTNIPQTREAIRNAVRQSVRSSSTICFVPRRLRKIETKKSIGNAINNISIPQEPKRGVVVWRWMDITRSLFLENRATEFAILLTVLSKCLPSFGGHCCGCIGILSFKALCDSHISCVL